MTPDELLEQNLSNPDFVIGKQIKTPDKYLEENLSNPDFVIGQQQAVEAVSKIQSTFKNEPVKEPEGVMEQIYEAGEKSTFEPEKLAKEEAHRKSKISYDFKTEKTKIDTSTLEDAGRVSTHFLSSTMGAIMSGVGHTAKKIGVTSDLIEDAVMGAAKAISVLAGAPNNLTDAQMKVYLDNKYEEYKRAKVEGLKPRSVVDQTGITGDVNEQIQQVAERAQGDKRTLEQSSPKSFFTDLMNSVDQFTAQNAAYWKEKAEEMELSPGVEFASEFAAGLVGSAPAIMDFMLFNPVFASIYGAAQARDEGKDMLMGAIKEGVLRYSMGKFFHYLHPLANKGIIGKIGQRTIGGAGFGIENVIRTVLEGGKPNPADVASSVATGFVFSGSKEHPRAAEARLYGKEIKRSEKIYGERINKIGGKTPTEAEIKSLIEQKTNINNMSEHRRMLYDYMGVRTDSTGKPYGMFGNVVNDIVDVAKQAREILGHSRGSIVIDDINKDISTLEEVKDRNKEHVFEDRKQRLTEFLSSRDKFGLIGKTGVDAKSGETWNIQIDPQYLTGEKIVEDNFTSPVEAKIIDNYEGNYVVQIGNFNYTIIPNDAVYFINKTGIHNKNVVGNEPKNFAQMDKDRDVLHIIEGQIEEKDVSDIGRRFNIIQLAGKKGGKFLTDETYEDNIYKISKKIDNIKSRFIGVKEEYDTVFIREQNISPQGGNKVRVQLARSFDEGDYFHLIDNKGNKQLYEVVGIDYKEGKENEPKKYKFFVKDKEAEKLISRYAYTLEKRTEPQARRFTDIHIPSNFGMETNLRMNAPKTYAYLLERLFDLRNYADNIKTNKFPEHISIPGTGGEYWENNRLKTGGITPTGEYAEYQQREKVLGVIYLDDGTPVAKTYSGLFTFDGRRVNENIVYNEEDVKLFGRFPVARTEYGIEPIVKRILYNEKTNFHHRWFVPKKFQLEIDRLKSGAKKSIIVNSIAAEGIKVGEIVNIEAAGKEVKRRVVRIIPNLTRDMVVKKVVNQAKVSGYDEYPNQLAMEISETEGYSDKTFSGKYYPGHGTRRVLDSTNKYTKYTNYPVTYLKLEPLNPPKYNIKKHQVNTIISGGQSGVDITGLRIGKELGYNTGGTAAAKYLAFDDKGNRISTPEYKELYGLKEGKWYTNPKTGKYDPYHRRTIDNAQEADGTVWFGNTDSPGARLTLGGEAQKNKPSPLTNPTSEELNNWLIKNNIRKLNVAGNREHTNIGISKKAEDVLRKTLGNFESKKEIKVDIKPIKQPKQTEEPVKTYNQKEPLSDTERASVELYDELMHILYITKGTLRQKWGSKMTEDWYSRAVDFFSNKETSTEKSVYTEEGAEIAKRLFEIVSKDYIRRLNNNDFEPSDMSLTDYLLSSGQVDADFMRYKTEMPKSKDKAERLALEEINRAWGFNPTTYRRKPTEREKIIETLHSEYLADSLTKRTSLSYPGDYMEFSIYGKSVGIQKAIHRDSIIKAIESGKIKFDSDRFQLALYDHPELFDMYINRFNLTNEWSDIEYKYMTEDIEKIEKPRVYPEDIAVDKFGRRIEHSDVKVTPRAPTDQIGSKQDVIMKTFQELLPGIKTESDSETGSVSIDTLLWMFSAGGYQAVRDSVKGFKDTRLKTLAMGDIKELSGMIDKLTLTYSDIIEEAALRKMKPIDYTVSLFNKMGLKLERDMTSEQLAVGISAERAAETFYHSFFSRKVDEYNKMITDENLAKLNLKYEDKMTSREKINESLEIGKDRFAKWLEDTKMQVMDASAAFRYLHGLPPSFRLDWEMATRDMHDSIPEQRRIIDAIVGNGMRMEDKAMFVRYQTLKDELHRAIRYEDGFEVWLDVGKEGRDYGVIKKEFDALDKELDNLPKQKRENIRRASNNWEVKTGQLVKELQDLGMLDNRAGWKTYVPYFVKDYSEGKYFGMRTGINRMKYKVQEYTYRATGTDRERIIDYDMMMDFYANAQHDIKMNKFIESTLVKYDLSQGFSRDIMKGLGAEDTEAVVYKNDKYIWVGSGEDAVVLKEGERGFVKAGTVPKSELTNGKPYQFYSPEYFRVRLERGVFQKNGEDIELEYKAGLKPTYLIPKSMIDFFKDLERTPNTNVVLKSINYLNNKMKAVAIYSSYINFMRNNMLGDIWLSSQMHPDKGKYWKEIIPAANFVWKINKELTGEKQNYTAFERRLKTFCEKYSVLEEGQIYGEIAYHKGTTVEKVKQSMLNKAWDRFNPRDLNQMRENWFRAANAAYVLKKVEAGEFADVEKGFKFLHDFEKEAKDEPEGIYMNDLDKAGIIANKFFVNYYRQSPTYRKWISGFLVPFGKWYLDMSAMQMRWMFKGNSKMERFVGGIKDNGKGGYSVSLGALPKGLVLTAVPYLAMDFFNYRDDETTKFERSLNDSVRSRFHLILWKTDEGYRVFTPQLPQDILIGTKTFSLLADLGLRVTHKELTKTQAIAELPRILQMELKGLTFIANPIIRFATGMANGKDPYDNTPVIPEYKVEQTMSKYERFSYHNIFLAKCLLPVVGQYIFQTEYKDKNRVPAIKESVNQLGLTGDFAELLGIKEMEQRQGIYRETAQGGERFISTNLWDEQIKMNQKESKVIRDIKSAWVKSGLSPEEFISTGIGKHVEELKKLHGDRIGEVANSLEKRIMNIFDNPYNQEKWLNNKIDITDDPEEARRLREIRNEIKKQAFFITKQQSLPLSIRSHAMDIIEKLGGEEKIIEGE